MSRRPIAFNNSTKTANSIKKNKVEVGVASDNYASSPGGLTWFNGADSTNQYVIYSDTFSLGMTTLANAKPVCWASGDLTDVNVLRMVNGLPTRYNQTPFTTIASALEFVAASATFNMVSGTLDNIVTDGLILNLDCSQKSSYPGSGPSWYDLSGNGYNGTLLNGPTYSSANGGNVVFDGSNDHVSIPSSTNWNLSTSSTVSVWCKPTNGSGWVIAFDKGSWNGWLISGSGSFTYNGQPGYDDGVYVGGVSLGSWQMFTVVIDRQNALYKGYKNGAYITQSSITQTPMAYATNLYLGSRGCVPDNFYNGAVSTACIYNRALSAAEVLQNYNAQKTKFGL
jgi:hypothetical protein